MKFLITPYFEDDNSIETPKGYHITHYDNYDNIVVVEEYVGSTAEEWLTMNGMGGDRQPTLLYLRQSLQMAGKTSLKLNQLEGYLQTVLGLYAQDSSPKLHWPPIPVSFEEAVKEAVMTLQEN